MKFRISDMIILFLLLCLDPLLTILRGNENIQSIISNKKCTQQDNHLLVGYFLLILISMFYTSHIVLERNRNRFVVNYEKSLPINKNKLVYNNFIIFLIGFIGTYSAAGTTAFFTLNLVFMELNSFVASPTSLILSTMMNASSSILFWLSGSIYTDAIIFCGIIILTASVVTRITIYEKILRMGKESYLLLFMMIMKLTSVPLNIYKVLPQVLDERKGGKDIWEWKSLCT